MSWDADFDGQSWNYTHNTNGMITAALNSISDEPPIAGSMWWYRLDNMTGPEGATYLGTIIQALQIEPAKYRAMNPDNGWGDYDQLLVVLREMKHASDTAACDCPTHRWHVSG